MKHRKIYRRHRVALSRLRGGAVPSAEILAELHAMGLIWMADGKPIITERGEREIYRKMGSRPPAPKTALAPGSLQALADHFNTRR